MIILLAGPLGSKTNKQKQYSSTHPQTYFLKHGLKNMKRTEQEETTIMATIGENEADGDDEIKLLRTLTKEHNTAENVRRDADAEDEGIEVAGEDALYVGESLEGNDVIGIVPRNKVVFVTISFAVTMVDLNLHYRLHFIRKEAKS